MNQKQLRQKLEKKQLDNLYIFCGDDYFLKEIYVNRIVKVSGFEPVKLNILQIDELEDIRFKILSEGLFDSSQRVYHLKLNFALDKKTILFKPKRHIVIFDPIECKLKNDATVEFTKPSFDEIKAYLKNKLKRENKAISEKNLDILSGYFVNQTTSMLYNETEKLLLYTIDKNSIELDDIQACLAHKTVFDFKMLQKLFEEKTQKGISDLVDAVLSTLSLPVFIYMLSKEVIKIYAACVCSEQCFEKLFGRFYFRYAGLAKDIGCKKVGVLLKKLYETDKLIKSSSNEYLSSYIKAMFVVWMQDEL
ncbi:DNA polymerase III subunit delta [Hippea jasoniae]|uniref:DNA polymerase III subunit delta n=1 Tax=Hippea jasoniae TaxID=944479 RepID=UPI0005518B37|nr:hypothetical protein [Hippea jasoniae]